MAEGAACKARSHQTQGPVPIPQASWEARKDRRDGLTKAMQKAGSFGRCGGWRSSGAVGLERRGWPQDSLLRWISLTLSWMQSIMGDWTAATAEDMRRELDSRCAADGGWVADGNYESKGGGLVRERADTVVWLDLGRRAVTIQLIARTARRALLREVLWVRLTTRAEVERFLTSAVAGRCDRLLHAKGRV